jgi:hypothetical protein
VVGRLSPGIESNGRVVFTLGIKEAACAHGFRNNVVPLAFYTLRE